MNLTNNKLSLARETLRILYDPDLRRIDGGGPDHPVRHPERADLYAGPDPCFDTDSCHPGDTNNFWSGGHGHNG
jgi:hypothetical protein